MADASIEVLDSIQRRVLWLSTRIVDLANRVRPNAEGVKVGGHQASSASLVTLMTVLWFDHLERGDRVAVKPHASPAFHAVQYLLGALDRSYLDQLRAFGGLQAYPSRTKDPDPVDYSTGSVGLGAVAPLFGAVMNRYAEAHFGERNAGTRFISVLGDAELDEGNVWEALVEPATDGLGNVTWVVDLNRQSLDRVVPGIKAAKLKRIFEDSGWHVAEAKYGHRLRSFFAQEDGEALREHIDAMSNEQYQSLFGLAGGTLRDRFLEEADPVVKRLLSDMPDEEMAALVTNLGGHDLRVVREVLEEADSVTDRPSVIFAYTVKGWGLPIAGDPFNHAALLTGEQIDALRAETGLDPETDLDRFDPDSPEGRLCEEVGRRLHEDGSEDTHRRAIEVPDAVGAGRRQRASTQETFGRLLVGLSREKGLGERLVTTSPDVATSTNLGGWINKVGIFAPEEKREYSDAERLLRWQEHPGGQHIELGISEMNFFMLLGQLGLSAELAGELLLPVGTLYDPFVCRGLDALIHGLYSGSKFIVAGTPSGVTLASEGGAHQSTITPSIGLELPGISACEPAYATELDWLLCDGLERLLDRENGESLYLRLSTRPVDQGPFEAARKRLGDDVLRRDVLAGGYRLLEADMPDAPLVNLLTCGAVVPEVLEAAALLEREGVAANVIEVTSLDRMYRSWRRQVTHGVRNGRYATGSHHLATLVPSRERSAPVVTVHDAASHAMAWVGAALGTTVVPLGVDGFGQSGTISDLYSAHELDAGSVLNAALLALGPDS